MAFINFLTIKCSSIVFKVTQVIRYILIQFSTNYTDNLIILIRDLLPYFFYFPILGSLNIFNVD